jgi:hypothetical protein
MTCEMEKVSFHQVKSDRQREQVGALIREYLGWLNERVEREYGLEFDIEAMMASDLTDPDKFEPPYGDGSVSRKLAAAAKPAAISNAMRASRNHENWGARRFFWRPALRAIVPPATSEPAP